MVAFLVLTAQPVAAQSFSIPISSSLPSEVPDLGLPDSLDFDLGKLIAVSDWFNPESLNDLRDVFLVANVFKRVIELPSDASMIDFFGAFTGIDTAFDEIYKAAKGMVSTYSSYDSYLKLIDPDGLLKKLEEESPTGNTYPLHSPPVAQTLGSSTKEHFPNKAKYPQTNRLSLIDTHPKQVADLLPYVEFSSGTDPEHLNTAIAPNLPLSGSIKSAQELRQNWQIFEERYFQRVKAVVQAPVPYLLHCTAGLTSSVPNPPDPLPGITVAPEDVSPEFYSLTRGRLSYPKYDSQLYLDPEQYALDALQVVSLVPGDYFCDGIGFKPPYWNPGWRIKICGQTVWETKDFPKPSSVDTVRLKRDVENAILHVHTKYLPEYLSNTLNSLIPNEEHPLLFPVPWEYPIPSLGSVYYPVSDMNATTLEPLNNMADKAKTLFDGSVTGELAPIYYYHPLLETSGDKTLKTISRLRQLIPLLEPNAIADGANGAWPLEELKRWLPPTNPIFSEIFGYQSFYRVNYTPGPVLLPEPLYAKVLRQPMLLYTSFEINICPKDPYILPYPGAEPVYNYVPELSYLALGYPFLGLQAHYEWVTVPEGYPMPNTSGNPLIDYRGLPMLQTSNARETR